MQEFLRTIRQNVTTVIPRREDAGKRSQTYTMINNFFLTCALVPSVLLSQERKESHFPVTYVAATTVYIAGGRNNASTLAIR